MGSEKEKVFQEREELVLLVVIFTTLTIVLVTIDNVYGFVLDEEGNIVYEDGSKDTLNEKISSYDISNEEDRQKIEDIKEEYEESVKETISGIEDDLEDAKTKEDRERIQDILEDYKEKLDKLQD